jgi:hypothetical protein
MAARRPSLVVALVVLACFGAAGQDLTYLHFYFHEVLVGTPNVTVVNVASLHRYVQ